MKNVTNSHECSYSNNAHPTLEWWSEANSWLEFRSTDLSKTRCLKFVLFCRNLSKQDICANTAAKFGRSMLVCSLKWREQIMNNLDPIEWPVSTYFSNSDRLRTGPTKKKQDSQNHLQACRGRFRAFGATCSKPWAIAQDFCSKSANFGPCGFTPHLHQQSRK